MDLGGGMCNVYLADDTHLPRQVVLKVLKKEAFRDLECYKRFRREAELACRCRHDNIVQTYDFVEDHDPPYMVIEYLQGESLRDLIDRHALTDRNRVLDIASQLAAAMEYVHSLDIIHRDIKPANIYIEASGRMKLMDFGIARTTDWTITDPGMAAGTLRYMSREQYLAKPERRSDIYAFGAVLFEMLTGQFVCKGETRTDLEAWILNGSADLGLLRDVDVPEPLIALTSHCLEKDPTRRPASFTEVRHQLDAIRDPLTKPPSPTRTPWWRYALWVAACCLFALAAVIFWRVVFPRSTQTSPTQTNKMEEGKSGGRKTLEVERILHFASGDMVLVDGGPALLGPNKTPMQVSTFYIDETEVSNRAYRVFCGAKPGCVRPGSENEPGDWPVVNVSYNDAEAFARWAGKRLPTANEWEKAARGADGRGLPWGDTLDATRANLESSQREPVSSHPDGKSPYGALNMVGNVYEWVDETDTPDDAQYAYLRKRDWVRHLRPALRRDEAYKQIRGGSYSFLGGYKLSDLPSLIYDSSVLPIRVARPEVGFRCAKDVTPTAKAGSSLENPRCAADNQWVSSGAKGV
jgi:serine/threonine-protein kinase